MSFSNHCQAIIQLSKGKKELIGWGNSSLIWRACVHTMIGRLFIDLLIISVHIPFRLKCAICARLRLRASINQFRWNRSLLINTVLESSTRKNCTSFSTQATWLMRHKSQLKKQINSSQKWRHSQHTKKEAHITNIHVRKTFQSN